jgi:hypothetical protein
MQYESDLWVVLPYPRIECSGIRCPHEVREQQAKSGWSANDRGETGHGGHLGDQHACKDHNAGVRTQPSTCQSLHLLPHPMKAHIAFKQTGFSISHFKSTNDLQGR